MKEPFSEETLSAYVDGELTPRERSEVEQWLADSPEARRKLDDFRRLSTLFAGLPRTEIAPEFPTKVLQLAERRMLLPETVAVSARRRFHRRILTVGGAIASAAAVLFVIVHFRDPGAPPNVAFRNEPLAPGTNLPGTSPVDHGRRGDLQPGGDMLAKNEGFDLEARSGAMPAAPPAVDQPSPGLARKGGAGAAAGSEAAHPLVADGGSFKKSPQKAAASRSAQESGTPEEGRRPSLRIAELSREIDRLGDADADGEHLSVMTLHIDHADGLTLVQKILVSNDVLPAGIRETKEKEDEKVELKSRALARPPTGNLKECLIVIAEPEKVIAALSEILESEDANIRLTIEAPLEIAALDAESQTLLRQSSADGELGGGEVQQRRRDAAAPGAASADKPEERGGKGKAGGAAAKSNGNADAAPGAPATSDKKKSAGVQRSEPAKSGPSDLLKDSLNPDNRLAKRKDSAADPNSDRAAMGQSRLFVVPVPKEIENRQLTAAEAKPIPPANRNSASREILATPAPKAAKQLSANDKVLSESEQAKRAPSLVRVLFVIEPGAAQPAAPAGKGPSGGAS